MLDLRLCDARLTMNRARAVASTVDAWHAALTPPAPERRTAFGHAARRELAKRSLVEFLRQGWSHFEAGEVEIAPHIEAVCFHVQLMLEGWLVANGLATQRQRDRILALHKRLGLTFREGRLLVQNLILNLPPGTLKSTILMVWAPAWMWLHAPRFSFACASSTDEVVKRDSQAHRDIVTSAWYRETFGVEWTIRKDADAIGKWQTTAGGKRLSRTIGSRWIGVHADGFFIDDPDDAHRVHNDVERTKTHNNFTRKMENRVNHEMRSIRIVCQQRVHVEDLSGYLYALSPWSRKNLEGWDRLSIPMEFKKPAANDNVPRETAFGWRDWRDEDGEVLQAERWPADMLADKRKKLGSHGYESQYNQNPEPLDGGMFRRGWFPFYRIADQTYEKRTRPAGCQERPKDGTDDTFVIQYRRGAQAGELDLDWITLSVDATFGSLKESASAVGLTVYAGKGVRRFLLMDYTIPMTFLQTVAAIKKAIRAFPVRRVLIELKANGASVVEVLEKELMESGLLGPNGQPVVVVIEGSDPGKDGKEARANAATIPVEAGTLYLPDTIPVWLEPWLTEICTFPNSRRSDRVDALSQLLARYSEGDSRAKRSAQW